MTFFASPNNNVAFNTVLEVEMKEALVRYPRPDLDLKFVFLLTRGLQAAHKSVQMALARDCRSVPKI